MISDPMPKPDRNNRYRWSVFFGADREEIVASTFAQAVAIAERFRRGTASHKATAAGPIDPTTGMCLWTRRVQDAQPSRKPAADLFSGES